MLSKLSQFWQELKRRNVTRVLAMYAATAFIIIEAADIMIPRLGMPDWIVTLLVILLIAGLPVTFILSWVFDITPQGVVKTAPTEETEQPVKSGVKHRRKLRISDLVIVLLFGAVVVLIYPKIFGSENARSSRGEISVAVMPFKNMTGDTVFNIWQGGMQNLLITALSNSEALSVLQYETMLNILRKDANTNYASLTPSIAVSAAKKTDANTIVVGNLYKSGGLIRITSNIMNTDSEEIYKSFELQGDTENDFFELADSLSQLIRDYLVIKKIKKDVFYEMKTVYTQSPEAYKFFLIGQNYYTFLDYPKAIEHLKKAIELDSGFVSAMVNLAYCYGDTRQAALSKKWAFKAYDQMHRLPQDMQFSVNVLIASVEKKPLDQIQYLNLYLSIHPQALIKYYQLGRINFVIEEWDDAIDAFERSIELAEKQGAVAWTWTYSMLGNAYHHLGEHKKEQKIFEEGRKQWPQQKSTYDYWQAVCAISRGDSIQAEFYLEEIRKMTEQRGWPEANLWLWYAGVYNWAEEYDRTEYYFQKAKLLKPDNPMLKGEFSLFLINRDINVEEGMKLIIPLVEEYPENATFWYTYGLGLYKQRSYEEASKALQKSWDLRPYYDHKNFTLLKEVKDILDRVQVS